MENSPVKKPVVICATIFLISMITLMFELTMTRIFSVILWYHFVFIVISISLLGLGLGGLIVNGLKKRDLIKDWNKFLSLIAIIYGFSIPIAMILLINYPFPEILIGYLAISVLPFLAGGVFTSALFQRYLSISNKLYFADLTGAALGSVGVVLLLKYLTPIEILPFLGVGSFIVGTCFALFGRERKQVLFALGSAGLIFILGVSNLSRGYLDLNLKYENLPTKSIFEFLRDESKERRIVETRWDAFSRVDLTEEEGNPIVKWIFTDGGAVSQMIRFDGDFSILSVLKLDAGYPPMTWGDKEKMLIIGSGGGKDVLLALMAGVNHIDAVEINKGIAAIVKKYSDFNGGIFNNDKVNFVVGDGRSFIDKSKETYNLIYLPLVFTQATEAIGYSLVENYIFTKEAFQSYFKHLTPGGRLVLKMHSDADSYRAIFTIIEILREKGLSYKDAAKRIIFFDRKGEGPHAHGKGSHYPVIVIENKEIQSARAEGIFKELVKDGFRPIHIPYYFEESIIGALALGKIKFKDLYRASPLELKPATDDKPFFYKEAKGLPVSLVQLFTIIIIAVVFFSIFVFSQANKASQVKKKRNKKYRKVNKNGLGQFFAYFALIGTGFMFIEMYLLQKYVLFLGHPTYSVAFVLLALLLSNGLGSLLTSLFSDETRERVFKHIGLLIFVFTILFSLGIPYLFESLSHLSTGLKLLVTIVSVMPLGVLMGMPFPLGLRELARKYSEDTALMWAVNGVFSVLGSVGAVVIAMSFGYTITLLLGGVGYFSLFALVRKNGIQRLIRE